MCLAGLACLLVTAPELVTRAKERLGVKTDTDLARALGLKDYAAPQRIRRWRLGQNEPDYEATLLLLEAAGLLNEEAAPHTAPLVIDSEMAAQMAAVLSAVERIESSVARIVSRASAPAPPSDLQLRSDAPRARQKTP